MLSKVAIAYGIVLVSYGPVLRQVVMDFGLRAWSLPFGGGDLTQVYNSISSNGANHHVVIKGRSHVIT